MHIVTREAHGKDKSKRWRETPFLHIREMSLPREKPIGNTPSVYCAHEPTNLTARDLNVTPERVGGIPSLNYGI